MDKISMFPVANEDLKWLLDLRDRVSEYLGNNDILTIEDQTAWFAKTRSDLSVRYFILKNSSATRVGMIRITQIDVVNRSACVGGDIHPKFQGQGYGKTMMGIVNNYCFEVLNLRRLWLFVLATNTRAKNLYKKSGFNVEGVQKEAIWRGGKYVDYVMMSLVKKEPK